MIEALVTKKYRVVVMDNTPTIALPGLFDGQIQKNVDLGKLGRLSKCSSGYSLLHFPEVVVFEVVRMLGGSKRGRISVALRPVPTPVLPPTKETMTCPRYFRVP
jgi:hypothetical protein